MTQHDPLIGKTINGYQISHLIGQGGMASVYQAVQLSMNRPVALKILPRQFMNDDTYIQRFRREVDIIARLEHRSIVPVYDFGAYEHQPYIIMRLMPAGSLDHLLANGRLALPRVVEILKQVAPALDYAHSKQVLHRDLKPSNLLLDDASSVYLTDFGIARILGEDARSAITTSGVVGTPAYMSPEQAQGMAMDSRSDLYSLGVMLFEFVTGRRPFESDTPYGVAVMQVTTAPPSLRPIAPEIPESVEAVIHRAMSKQPERRYSNCLQLAQAFEQAVTTPSAANNNPRRVFVVPPPQPITPPYSAATMLPPVSATPPAYSPAMNKNPSRPNQSAWIPAVQPPSRSLKRRRGLNPLASVFIGGLIGCALLTLLIAAAAVMLTRFSDILGNTSATVIETPTEEPAPTIEIRTDPTRTLAANDGGTATLPTQTAIRIESTPVVQVTVITQTPVKVTPSPAPVGVRP